MPTPTPEQHLDPTYTGPRPCPLMPSGGIWSIGSCITIQAHCSVVREALVDIGRWGEWNSFVPKVEVKGKVEAPEEITMQESIPMMFHVRMVKDGPLTTSPERATHLGPLCSLDDEQRAEAKRQGKPNPVTELRWGGEILPGWLLKAEHVNQIEDLGNGMSKYTHWETFGGPVAYAIKFVHGENLRKNFIQWSEDLKEYCEKKAAS